jgi:hypothetical protein
METNMLLSYHDIKKIQKRGIDLIFFIEDSNGWLRLKNSHGRCVFHNGNTCTIYEDKPQGCTLYPVVYDTDNQRAILDEECPQKHCFPLKKSIVHQLHALVTTLEHERNQRQYTHKKEHSTMKK